ncbi:poly [ADP-ribose] polymerase tankyrase-like [Liolophura sinensis]|uniref:poly [ADP-ribose] polymerase tankyrase-like n=1 Tax=Liolophura sinensis TaxID=3198878 RepID=UPI0031590F9B
MDIVPSLRRKATSLLSTDTVDLAVKKRKSLTSSLSSSLSSSLTRTSSKVVKTVKTTTVSTAKTVLHSLKPAKLRKNPTRERRKPKILQDEPVKNMEKPTHANNNDRSKLRFLRLTHLSVRNEEDSFFLCRALQNVFAHTKRFRVQWLTFDPKTQIYRVDYVEDITPDSVLATVRLKRVGAGEYKLHEADRLETERLLKKSINKDKGLDVSDEESDDEEPPAKKKKKETKKTTKTAKKGKKDMKEKKERKPRSKKDKAEKAPRKRKVSKKNEDLELHPNPAIKVLDKDPFFETKDKVPFVSKFVHGKLIIRAVLLNDMKMLKKLSQDKDKIYNLNSTRAPAIPLTAMEYAILKNNSDAIKTLRNIEYDPSYQKPRHREQIMISRLGTGSYNRRSLGVSFIREIMASRGTREGNNALTKDVSDMASNCRADSWKLLRMAFQAGCDWELVKAFIKDNFLSSDRDLEDLSSYNAKNVFKEIGRALWRGHYKLARELLKWASEHSTTGFQAIHAKVLLEDVKEMKKINPSDVTYSSSVHPGCAPIHIAAVNPDSRMLKHLLDISPDINCNDQTQKSPVHYAAVCESTGPLEVLLKMGASSLGVDKENNTPLHMACEAGRNKNVEVLLGSNPDLKSAQGEIIEQRYGKGGIHRMNKSSYQPIHLAVENGHLQVVKVLLKHGANINAQISIGKFRLTPLMLATDQGHYELVRYLVDNGAVVKQRDRLGRTALIHAVMNGHTHIASYLLNLGANPNTADSSNNTAIHYAAAYGWPHLTQLLLEAGADPNTQSLWKISPVSIAWLKGHRGIVSILLEDERVDVNFRDDRGQTLVHIAASSPLAKDLYDQMEYLIEEKGGDATAVSMEGDTALTLLLFAPQNTGEDGIDFGMYEARRRKIAELLLKHGCPIDTVKKSGETVLDLAVKKASHDMSLFLIEKGASISNHQDENGDNLLHCICRESIEFNFLLILQLLLEKTPTKATDKGTDFVAILKSMANQHNHEGFTPLLLACKKYGENFHAPGKDDKERRLWWRKKREFLKVLVEKLGSDVNAVVGMRRQEGDTDVSEKLRYGPSGKQSVLDLLLDARDMSDPDGPWGANPAIRMMLNYHVDPNNRSIDGRTPLCKAVRKGHPDLIAMLLENGADVNMGETDEEGNVIRTPFIEAISSVIEEGVVKILKMMLKKGARINEKVPKTGGTALHKIVTLSDDARQVKVMKPFMTFGPDLDVRDGNGRTPLHLAVNNNRGSINSSNLVEEMLIDNGADVFAKDNQSRMPISYVFSHVGRESDSSQIDPTELCRLLATAMNFKQLDHQDCNGQTVLHLAAFRGAYLSCVYLLQRAPYLKVSQGDNSGTSALGYAVKNNYDNCACMLIQHEPAAVSVPIVTMPKDQPTKKTSEESDMSDDDDDDDTSDDYDSDFSDSDSDTYQRKKEAKKQAAMKNIKERPPKPIWMWKPLKREEKVSDIVKTSIFQAAIRQELQGTVFMILELPHSVSDLTNFKAIEIAIGEGKNWVTLRLMSRIRDKAEFRLTNDSGQNFFHIMALKWSKRSSEHCFNMVTDLLLEHDVPLDKKDKYGCTPIFYAAYNHNFVMTEFFLSKQKKLDASVKDKFGRTLVAATLFNWEAAMNNEYDVGLFLNKLYSHKAALDDRFDFQGGRKVFGTKLPQGDKSYFKEGSGPLVSPLIRAILTDNFSFAQYLLKSKASVNYTDADGIYPLMHAVRQNDVKLVKLMLDHNYDPILEQRQIDEEKQKALEKAERKKQLAKSKANKFSLKRVASVQSEDSDDEKSESEAEEENTEEEEEDETSRYRAVAKKSKVNLNAQDKSGWTALHHCVRPLSLGTFDNETSRYRAVAKKSKVNLNAQDKSGWTALHHCVRPLSLGTFDNAEIVWTLARAGANLNIKDKEGLTPLDIALKSGAEKISKIIQQIMNIDEKKQKQPVLEEWPAVDDGLVWKTPAPDVEKDAEALLRKLNEDKMDEDTPALQEEIDDQCEIKATGELVTDSDLKRPFSALLTKVDIKHGVYGMYNFYKLQLVRQKGKDMYILFTRWGRIGDSGQFQHTPFASMEEAVKEFRKVYREKSGNHWADRNGEFEAKYNKYRVVTLDEEHPGIKQDQVKVNLVSKVPSKLPPYIQDTMREFTSVENLNAAMKREIDVELLPFGRLKKEDLLTAKKVLLDLAKVLTEADEMAGELADADKQEYWRKRDQVSRLSSQFYQLIPKRDFVYEKIRPLSISDIHTEMRVVNNLLDYEKASKIILGAEYRKKEINPLDYVYRALNCKVRLLKEDDEMTQYILRYISASDSSANVEAIYSLSRDGEEPSDLGNQKLLFHGSGVPNFIGILNQGLLVAPPGVQISGALYGEGIYTSHAFRKSKGYCYNYVTGSKLRYMLLCQVALGKPDTSYRRDNGPRPGFDSVSSWKPSFQYEVKLPSGVGVPLDQTGYSNSEFIVYKPDQVVLRYLVQFRT